MRKLNFIITFLCIVLLFQCTSTKNISEQDKLASVIKGTWVIDHEVCCGRISATTYGGNKSIQFNTKKSIYTIYNGSTIEKQGQYSLSTKEIGTMIQLDDRMPAILRITDGKLFIDWSYMDLRREVYKRN